MQYTYDVKSNYMTTFLYYNWSIWREQALAKVAKGCQLKDINIRPYPFPSKLIGVPDYALQ